MHDRDAERTTSELRQVGGDPPSAVCVAALGKKDVLIASYGLVVGDTERLCGRAFATLVLESARAAIRARPRSSHRRRQLGLGRRR